MLAASWIVELHQIKLDAVVLDGFLEPRIEFYGYAIVVQAG